MRPSGYGNQPLRGQFRNLWFHIVTTLNVLPVRFINVNTIGSAAAFRVDGDVGRDLWLHTGQNWNEAQLQTRFQQGCLILLVDVCGFVEVVRQTHPTGLIAIHQVQQQVHVGQCLDGHRGAVGGCAIDIGVDNRLAIDLGDFEGQLEQVFQAQLVVVGSHKPRQIFLGFFVLVVLLCALAQVKDRQRFAFFVLPGTVDDLVNVLERFLVRSEHDTETCGFET